MSSRLGQLILAALWLTACVNAPAANDIAGLYRHAGPVGATLEVRPEGGLYRIRLEGGGAWQAGAASAADCVIEARGELQGAVLRAPFGAVETDTFAYGADQAASEGRSVEIVFEPGAATVVAADTFGYCGPGAEFAGRYRAAE